MAGSDQFEATRAAQALQNSYAVGDMPAAEGYDWLLEANPGREGLILHNTSDAPVKVLFATDNSGPGASDLTFILQAGGSYESGVVVFTGWVYVATVAGTTGGIYSTELVR